MSILKHVSGYNYSKESMSKLINYVTEPYKTNNGRYICTRGCSKNSILRNMYTIKRAHHKEKGKQGEHFVISITPDNPKVTDDDYVEIGRRMADYYTKYQSVVALHKDSKVRHLHIVINGTSFVDGKKFSQSPSGLNSFKNSCNKILSDYGLDPIKCNPNEITDSKDYSFEDDLDFLEIFEDIPDDDWNSKSFKLSDLVIDASKDIQYDPDEYIRITTKTGMKIAYRKPRRNKTYSNESEGIKMNNNYIYPNIYGYNPVYTSPIYNSAMYEDAVQQVTPSGSTAPSTGFIPVAQQSSSIVAQAATPPLPDFILNNSRNVTVNVRNTSELNAAIKLSNSVAPMSNDEKAANIKMAMAASCKLQKAGHSVNIILDNSTNYNINIVDEKEEEMELIELKPEDPE